MPSNDTANIYSSEYRNGGTPSTPTTAADVTYDNTTSGLTADDVQEAIDELASGIGTVEETVGDETAGLVKDVDDLQEDIGDIQIVSTSGVVSVVAEATDTYSDMIGKVITAFNNYLDTLSDDEFVVLDKVYSVAGNGRWISGGTFSKATHFTSGTGILWAFSDSWTTQVINHVYFNATASSCHWLRTLLKATPSYAENMISELYGTGMDLRFIFNVYKRLS